MPCPPPEACPCHPVAVPQLASASIAKREEPPHLKHLHRVISRTTLSSRTTCPTPPSPSSLESSTGCWQEEDRTCRHQDRSSSTYRQAGLIARLTAGHGHRHRPRSAQLPPTRSPRCGSASRHHDDAHAFQQLHNPQQPPHNPLVLARASTGLPVVSSIAGEPAAASNSHHESHLSFKYGKSPFQTLPRLQKYRLGCIHLRGVGSAGVACVRRVRHLWRA